MPTKIFPFESLKIVVVSALFKPVAIVFLGSFIFSKSLSLILKTSIPPSVVLIHSRSLLSLIIPVTELELKEFENPGILFKDSNLL